MDAEKYTYSRRTLLGKMAAEGYTLWTRASGTVARGGPSKILSTGAPPAGDRKTAR
jgi:hypothetical protein